MPLVDISLARGKSAEYLEAVSRAVHDALVAELQVTSSRRPQAAAGVEILRRPRRSGHRVR